jgi:lipoprotein-anchoring transpeptidase ErfK/SrfK
MIKRLIIALHSVCLLASCATSEKLELRAAQPVKPVEPVLYDWQGDQLSGPVSVRVSLAEQKAYIKRGGQSAGWTYIASGRANYPTPRGSFRITEKVRDKRSNKYGMIVNGSGGIVDTDAARGRETVPSGARFVGAPMPCWMRLTGYGIGMHAGPIPDPGFPASHGCIRLPTAMAEKLFELAEIGTPVLVE